MVSTNSLPGSSTPKTPARRHRARAVAAASGLTSSPSAERSSSSSSSSNEDAASPEEVAPQATPRAFSGLSCDWCHKKQLACDNHLPCGHCQGRGGDCRRHKPATFRDLAAANSYIDNLYGHTQVLEDQIRIITQSSGRLDIPPTPNNTPTGPQSPSSSPHGNNGGAVSPKRRRWIGSAAVQTGQHRFYGPLSTGYVVARLRTYLQEKQAAEVPRNPDGPHQIPTFVSQVSGASDQALLNSPIASSHVHQPVALVNIDGFGRSQERYFLESFWETFDSFYPILTEVDFNVLYSPLWVSGAFSETRLESALVDSILALSIQHSGATVSGNDQTTLVLNLGSDRVGLASPLNTAQVAHAFHQRSQRLLQRELETPRLTTVHTCIYSIIYLQQASFFDQAHQLIGATISLARAQGQHLPPLPMVEAVAAERHARIWAVLYQLDSHISMVVGRDPFIVASSYENLVPAPAENPDEPGPKLLSPCQIPIKWETFQEQHLKLTICGRNARTALQRKIEELMAAHNLDDIYDNPLVFESLARFLNENTETLSPISHWIAKVPTKLKIKRKTRDAMSNDTETSSLDFGTTGKVWIRRQKIHLELVYHHMMIGLYGAFLRLPRPVSAASRSIPLNVPTPMADFHATSALKHAAAFSQVLLQVLTETSLVKGWPNLLQMQWDAFICMATYLIGRGNTADFRNARGGMLTALRALEHMSHANDDAMSLFLTAQRLVRQECSMVVNLNRGTNRTAGGQFQPSHVENGAAGPSTGTMPATPPPDEIAMPPPRNSPDGLLSNPTGTGVFQLNPNVGGHTPPAVAPSQPQTNLTLTLNPPGMGVFSCLPSVPPPPPALPPSYTPYSQTQAGQQPLAMETSNTVGLPTPPESICDFIPMSYDASEAHASHAQSHYRGSYHGSVPMAQTNTFGGLGESFNHPGLPSGMSSSMTTNYMMPQAPSNTIDTTRVPSSYLMQWESGANNVNYPNLPTSWGALGQNLDGGENNMTM